MNTQRQVGVDELALASWRKSSRSGNSANCVEISHVIASMVAVRDSKNQSGPVLLFPAREWEIFAHGLRDGAFD